jgi:hypothetical protein
VRNINYARKGLRRIDMSGVRSGIVYENVVEVDLNKAYWVAAKKLGVISEELYEKGLNSEFSKTELLSSIGALAKQVKERYFNGTRYLKSVVVIDSAKTRHIWDAVSWEVDKCMKECAVVLGKEFLFYWTDACLFVNNKTNNAAVRSIIKKHGFELKLIPVEYVEKVNGVTVVWTRENKSHAQKPRRDDRGNYAREFNYVESNLDFNKKINELINSNEKLKF